jgi:hypothetical protein
MQPCQPDSDDEPCVCQRQRRRLPACCLGKAAEVLTQQPITQEAFEPACAGCPLTPNSNHLTVSLYVREAAQKPPRQALPAHRYSRPLLMPGWCCACKYLARLGLQLELLLRTCRLVTPLFRRTWLAWYNAVACHACTRLSGPACMAAWVARHTCDILARLIWRWRAPS